MKIVKKIVKKTSRRKTVKKISTSKIVKKTKKAKAKIVSVSALKKNLHNPILEPQQKNGWEAWQTFNPGAILLDDTVHFLYRAIGKDGISRLGYASSKDGFHIRERLSFPVYKHQVKRRSISVFSYFSGGSWGGVEDPRIVRVDDEDTLYMTYTACSGDIRVALTSIKLKDFLNKKWNWKPPILISPPEEVHKNWVIFPEKIKGRYAILHSINPEISIDYVDSLEFHPGTYINSYHGDKPRKNCWDKWVRGVGPVPIRTKYGWLLFYHAMDDDWSKYKVGAMLLDFNDPTKILRRSKKPVLIPSEHYENFGFKAGVVYASGAVVKEENLLVYYGGADSYVCVAHANFDEFVEALMKEKQPKLKRKTLKKK